MTSKSNSPNIGTIASVRGSVVDIRFEDRLPPIYSLLRCDLHTRQPTLVAPGQSVAT